MSNVRVDTRLQLSTMDGRNFGAQVINGDISGAVIAGGTLGGFFGGISRSSLTIDGASVSLDGDLINHGAWATGTGGGRANITNFFSDGNATIFFGDVQVNNNGNLWGSGGITLNPGSVYHNQAASFAASLLTSGALKLGSLTTGFTSPNCGTFTNNGVTQVDTTPAAGHWPANAPFVWSLNTVGGTAYGSGGPFFSAAVTQDNLFTKAVTANCNDVYNFCAMPMSVSITAANLDLFNGLQDINTGARFSNTN